VPTEVVGPPECVRRRLPGARAHDSRKRVRCASSVGLQVLNGQALRASGAGARRERLRSSRSASRPRSLSLYIACPVRGSTAVGSKNSTRNAISQAGRTRDSSMLRSQHNRSSRVLRVPASSPRRSRSVRSEPWDRSVALAGWRWRFCIRAGPSSPEPSIAMTRPRSRRANLRCVPGRRGADGCRAHRRDDLASAVLFDGPVSPMRATIGRRVPDHGEWVIEPKWDGIRALAHVCPDGPFSPLTPHRGTRASVVGPGPLPNREGGGCLALGRQLGVTAGGQILRSPRRRAAAAPTAGRRGAALLAGDRRRPASRIGRAVVSHRRVHARRRCRGRDHLRWGVPSRQKMPISTPVKRRT